MNSQFSFSISSDLLTKAHNYAKKHGLSLSHIIREHLLSITTLEKLMDSTTFDLYTYYDESKPITLKPNSWCRVCDEAVQAYVLPDNTNDPKCTNCHNYVIHP